MRTLCLALLFVAAATLTAHAQATAAPEGARVAFAEVAGVPSDQLTPELRADIAALVGTPLAAARLQELAARLEREKPEFVAAVRSELLPDGEARVAFVAARISDNRELLANINARYPIESVTVTGVIKEEALRQNVRDELHAAVGRPLDPAEGDRLTGLIQSQFSKTSGFDVRRRFERGTQPGQLRLIFDVTLLLDFEPGSLIIGGPLGLWYQPRIVYHEKQGWSSSLNLPIGVKGNQLTFGLSIANEDELIEQYSGFRVRFGRRNVGTPYVGASVDFSYNTESWREATLVAVDADPAIPPAYESRIMLQPRVTMRLPKLPGITGGLILASLDPLAPGSSSVVSAAIVGVASGRTWVSGSATHNVSASYELHAASDALNSDIDYTKHLFSAGYEYRQGRNRVVATVKGGRAHGEMPLFERFTLGDTNTLRGWNKFDLAPAGGTRMYYESVEYRYWIFGVFLDAGSVWDQHGSSSMKYSTGLTVRRGLFMTLAVPLEADPGLTFMAGLRF